jgi:iron complex outermembrane receptor protein
MGWQIIPSIRLRATNGTSYRAPGLYELFLGNQTGFLGQLQVDPCVNWGADQTDLNIRRNCQLAGIPDDYDGTGSSAEVVSGGGAGVVKPETSKSFTTGLVFTPEFANISASLDYFQIEVNDQISQLGASAVTSCYALPVFPNNFCSLFDRNPGGLPTGSYNITQLRDPYININRQITRGYDLNVRWDGDFTFGTVEVETQVTYTTEQTFLLFDTAEASGFATDDVLGTISNPKLVGNVRTALNRGDFTYTWGMRYVDQTENLFFNGTGNPVAPYRGTANAVYDIVAEDVLYHSFSVRYAADSWNLVVGVNNAFDKAPPTVSTAAATRYGNVPAFATQYDWFGRELFARFSYQF